MASNYHSVKIVCLAKSRKLSAHCVAGKIFDGENKGRWIRPVSKVATGELSNRDIGFEGGGQVQLYDIVHVPLVSASAHAFQNENHLIERTVYWEKVGTTDYAGLGEFVDLIEGPLWDCSSSSTEGLRDRVPEEDARAAVEEFGNSLCLIEVDNLVVSVRIEGADFGNPRQRIRGKFDYKGHKYILAVTDPAIVSEFASTIGEYSIGTAMLCISLGEAHLGYAYKLIAAIYRA